MLSSDEIREPREMTIKLRRIDQALPIALLRAREATVRKFKPHVDALGLSMEQWRVIRALAENDTLPATELAEQCAVLPSSMTRILNALLKHGHIEPAYGEDGRRRLVKLTKSGKAAYSQMAVKSEAVYHAIEQRFSSEKMGALLQLLEELRQAANGLDDALLPSADLDDRPKRSGR